MSDCKTATLEATDVQNVLEAMRKKLAKEFGVTVQTDSNGAFGPMGAYVRDAAHGWRGRRFDNSIDVS